MSKIYSAGDKIITYFEDTSKEIDEYFTKISYNRKNIYKEYKRTIEELSRTIFFILCTLCEGNFKNKESKNNLKYMGIKKFNRFSYLEIMIFYLFIATLSVQQSNFPSPLKLELAKALLDDHWIWLENSKKYSSGIDKIDKLRIRRFKEYKEVYDIIFVNTNTETWLKGMYILFDILKDVLHPKKTKENIFDLLPLLSFYTGSIFSYTPMFIKQIDRTEIVNREKKIKKDANY